MPTLRRLGVFRYTSGGWQLIPGGLHPNILNLGIARSGNSIVEKATIRYPGETICLASGVRARVWHWNGSRLVAGPWKVITTGPKTVRLTIFVTSDRKVGCSVSDTVWCATNPPGPHVHFAELQRNGMVRICDATPADICLQNAITHGPVFALASERASGLPLHCEEQRDHLHGDRGHREREGLLDQQQWGRSSWIPDSGGQPGTGCTRVCLMLSVVADTTRL